MSKYLCESVTNPDAGILSSLNGSMSARMISYKFRDSVWVKKFSQDFIDLAFSGCIPKLKLLGVKPPLSLSGAKTCGSSDFYRFHVGSSTSYTIFFIGKTNNSYGMIILSFKFLKVLRTSILCTIPAPSS